MKNFDWNKVQDVTDRKTLKAGGYVIGIVKAIDHPNEEYLEVQFDIAEGEYRHYFSDMAKSLIDGGRLSKGDWPYQGIDRRYYSQKALPFFKGFKTAVEQSNAGYTFSGDENTFRGKLVGVILREEEYISPVDGSTRTRLRVDRYTSADNIRSGNFEVPEKKPAQQAAQQTSARPSAFAPAYSQGGNDFAPIPDDDDLPF